MRSMFDGRLGVAFLLVIAGLGSAGCASRPYRYGGVYHTQHDVAFRPGEPQIERGRKMPVLDTAGWIVGIPAKVVMLDHRVDNHDVSPQTEAAIHNYLADNELDRVKVRLNQYDPGGEWRRLVDNKSVGWPARYTIGTLSLVVYTVLPGRLIGGDNYNPYTNTINVYSDVPAIGLYQGGHAKDYAQRRYKGTYAVASLVPGVNLYHNAKASSDALSYLAETGSPEQQKEGYRSACPMYALRTSEPISAVTGAGVMLPAVVAGHVVGQVQAVNVHHSELPPELPPQIGSTTYSAPLPLR